MINERIRELIHASVDGELDVAEKSELKQVLDASEEARHYLSELHRLSKFLDKIPDHELPDGLHARITENIDLPKRSSIKSIFSFGEFPSFLRYGFAAAAGLVLAVAIFQNRDQIRDPQDYSGMVGTMIKGGPQGISKTLDEFEFKLDGVSAQASLQQRNGSLVLEMQLDSAEALDFSIDFSSLGLGFEAFAQMDSELDTIAYANQSVSGSGSGRQRFVLLLNRDDQAGAHPAGAGSGIGLAFSKQGTNIRSGRLELNW